MCSPGPNLVPGVQRGTAVVSPYSHISKLLRTWLTRTWRVLLRVENRQDESGKSQKYEQRSRGELSVSMVPNKCLNARTWLFVPI